MLDGNFTADLKPTKKFKNKILGYDSSGVVPTLENPTPATAASLHNQTYRKVMMDAGQPLPPFRLMLGKGGYQPLVSRYRSVNTGKEVPPEDDHPSVVMIPWDLLVRFLQQDRPEDCKCSAAGAKLDVQYGSYRGAALKLRITCNLCKNFHDVMLGERCVELDPVQKARPYRKAGDDSSLTIGQTASDAATIQEAALQAEEAAEEGVDEVDEEDILEQSDHELGEVIELTGTGQAALDPTIKKITVSTTDIRNMLNVILHGGRYEDYRSGLASLAVEPHVFRAFEDFLLPIIETFYYDTIMPKVWEVIGRRISFGQKSLVLEYDGSYTQRTTVNKGGRCKRYRWEFITLSRTLLPCQ